MAYTLIVDASDWGWGAWCISDQGLTCDARPWSDAEKAEGRMKKSVYAEPEGVKRALYRFVPANCDKRVLVLTDSSTAHRALQKGHSASFPINKVSFLLQSV